MKKSTESDRVFDAFDEILRIVFQQFGIPGFLRGPALARMKRHGFKETREFMVCVAGLGTRAVLDPDELEYVRNAIEEHKPSAGERDTYDRLITKARRLGLAHASR